MKRFLLRTILVLLTGCIGSNAIAQTNLYNYSVLSGTFSDISSTGTVVGGSVPLGATVLDRTTTSIPIGFTFNFCGTNYTQLSASNHCWLSLANSGSTIYVNAAGNIPSAGFLYFFWDDMGGSGADAYYQTTGTAPNRVFTIQYTDWRGNPSPWTAGTGTSDMQVKLYETTNVIEYWYGPGTLTGLTSSVGIANSTTDYKSANAGYATATYGSIYTAHSTPPTSGTILRWSTCSVTATPATSGAVCPGGTVTLTATTSGTSYSWAGPAGYTSTNLTNVLTGVTTTGVYTFSATNGTCTTTATTTVSVNPVPPAPSLTPSVTTMCNGAVQSLTSSAAAVWSPTTDLYTDAAYTTPYTGGVTSTVYVHPTTVSAVTVRTYTATVTNGFGCTSSSVATVTINPATAAITGTLSVCAGYTTTLSSTSSGGTWSSTATGVATVGSSSGIVTGGSPGTSTIIYTVAGCSSVAVVTVTPTPAPITGVAIACLGATTTLSTTPAGGTWSSSNPAIGTINASTGVVGGVSLGTITTTYDLGSGCFVTRTVSVNPIPAAISGPASVCLGASATLTSSPSGGIWTATSTPAGVCSVGPTTGIVNGLALGTSTIRYQVAGCSVTRVMTVVATSTPPFGPTVCVGSTGTFTTTAAGGTWSSSNTAVGTIGSTTGVLYGVSAGTTVITYALSAGCTSTVVATVTPAPSAIVGATSVCEGLTTTLTHPTAGGTWTSSDPTIASIGLGTGVVTGVSATPAPGTATITYTLPSGCYTTMTFTVLPTPGAITGTLALCQSQTATLSSFTVGGTWSSGTTTVATIDPATGLWTAVGVGTSTITYTSAAGCITTAVVTVNGIPSAITGPGAVCVGQTITLSSTTPMGAWSSSTPAVATISGSGDVTGLTAGTTDITYALASGCYVTKTVTVNAGPAAITGSPLGICVGASTFLSCATWGGTWTSSAPTVASILSPGMIGGVSVGTATISYTIGATGCASTVVVTVNTLPGAIGGSLSVCAGQTSTLTNSSAGGSWSSAIPLVGTIDPTTGVFGGVAAGTTTITYSLGTGCTVTAIATVNATPTITGGSTNICAGTTTTFTGAPTGGTWASGTTTVATIGVGTGLATGVAPGGTTTITYTLTSGCRNTTVLTVTPLPAVITGTTSLCVGQTTTLSSATAGGTWSSSNLAVGTISTGGVVTGLGAGTTTITYAVSGCSRTTVVLVNGLPTSITPSGAGAQVCEGSTISMTGAPSGGTWSSSCTGIGSIATGSGTYTGISAGTCTVTYTLSTGCSLVSSPITVNALPATIGGVASVCVGQTTTLNSTPATGTWSLSSGTGTATIGSTTGVVTGGTAGTVNVTYTLPTGCRRTIVVTVNALPGLITGAANVCAGSTTTMNCTPAGGTWTISGSIATIGVTTGIVTGVSAGTTDVTYTAGAGCFSTRTITVNPVPDPITGTATTCVGQTTTLSTLSTGGTWSISPLATATIGSGTGVVTGVSGGTGSATATVTYTLPTTCRTTQ
ncbi:MAG: hypothetical protein JNM41_03175, partial [Flavipsychrobacter sp.]|nr:hypothetical protein [Flavipsychrobacter sp.]